MPRKDRQIPLATDPRSSEEDDLKVAGLLVLAGSSMLGCHLPKTLRQWLGRTADHLYFFMIKKYFDLLCLVAESIYFIRRVR
jgi:hypothetical protein